MPATCKCANGHVFTSKVVEDSPEINALPVYDDYCPECHADFEVIDVYDDPPDYEPG